LLSAFGRGPFISIYVSSRPRAQGARAERSVDLGNCPPRPRTHRLFLSEAEGRVEWISPLWPLGPSVEMTYLGLSNEAVTKSGIWIWVYGVGELPLPISTSPRLHLVSVSTDATSPDSGWFPLVSARCRQRPEPRFCRGSRFEDFDTDAAHGSVHSAWYHVPFPAHLHRFGPSCSRGNHIKKGLFIRI